MGQGRGSQVAGIGPKATRAGCLRGTEWNMGVMGVWGASRTGHPSGWRPRQIPDLLDSQGISVEACRRGHRGEGSQKEGKRGRNTKKEERPSQRRGGGAERRVRARQDQRIWQPRSPLRPLRWSE